MFAKIIISLFLLISACTVINTRTAEAATTDWPMVQFDNNFTGHNAASSSDLVPPLTLQWLRNDVGRSPGSRPIIYGNTVFLKEGAAYGDPGRISALDKTTGTTLWTTTGDESFETRGMAVKDGLLYTLDLFNPGGVRTITLRAIRVEDGTTVSTVVIPDTTSGIGFSASSIIFDENFLYFRVANYIYSYNIQTLTQQWSFPTSENPFHGTAPVLGNGKVFFSTRDFNTVFALNATTGTQIWSHNFGTGKADVNPLYSPAQNALIIETSSGLFSFNADTGIVNWTNPSYTADYLRNLGLSNTTLVAYKNGGIGAVNVLNGQEIWSQNTYTTQWGPHQGLPIANNIVYFADFEGRILAYRLTDGALLYSYKRDGAFGTSVAFSGQDTYVAEGTFSTVKTAYKLSPWTLTGNINFSESNPGQTIEITAQSSMLQKDPQTIAENKVQALMPSGEKVPLSFTGTTGGLRTWKGSYSVPLTTPVGPYTINLEAVAYNTTTQTSVNFVNLPVGFINKGMSTSLQLPIVLPHLIPQLLSPVQNITLNSPPLLTWTPLQPPGNPILFQELLLNGKTLESNLSSTTSNYQLPTSLLLGNYTWQIVAHSSGGHRFESSIRTFIFAAIPPVSTPQLAKTGDSPYISLAISLVLLVFMVGLKIERNNEN